MISLFVGLVIGTAFGFLACAILTIGPRKEAECAAYRRAYAQGVEDGYAAQAVVARVARSATHDEAGDEVSA